MMKLLRLLIIVPLLCVLVYFGYPFPLRGIGHFLVAEDRLEKAGAIAVLAGDGGVAQTLEAARLYQDKYAPMIILTHQLLPKGYEALGRMGTSVPEERDIQWMVLRAMQIPPAAVLQVKERADSTQSEMMSLTRLLKENGIQSVILVTNRSHSTRARKLLAKASGGKIAIISRPTRYDSFDPAGWWHSRLDAKEVLEEYEKLVVYGVISVGTSLIGWLKGENEPPPKPQPEHRSVERGRDVDAREGKSQPR